jgi:hypothetical protein
MDGAVARAAGTVDLGVRRELLLALYAWLTVTLLSLGVTWAFSGLVMTPEAYHALLGSRMEAARIDRYVDLLRQTAWFGYLMTAAILLVRLLGSALLLQFFALCGGLALPFRRMLLVSAWAYTALIGQVVARTVYLWRLDGTLTEGLIASQPGSLANLLLDPGAFRTLPFALLSMVNVSEAVWIILTVLLLGRVTPLGAGARIAIALAVWMTTAAFQGALAVYLVGLAS